MLNVSLCTVCFTVTTFADTRISLLYASTFVYFTLHFYCSVKPSIRSGLRLAICEDRPWCRVYRLPQPAVERRWRHCTRNRNTTFTTVLRISEKIHVMRKLLIPSSRRELLIHLSFHMSSFFIFHGMVRWKWYLTLYHSSFLWMWLLWTQEKYTLSLWINKQRV